MLSACKRCRKMDGACPQPPETIKCSANLSDTPALLLKAVCTQLSSLGAHSVGLEWSHLRKDSKRCFGETLPQSSFSCFTPASPLQSHGLVWGGAGGKRRVCGACLGLRWGCTGNFWLAFLQRHGEKTICIYVLKDVNLLRVIFHRFYWLISGFEGLTAMSVCPL